MLWSRVLFGALFQGTRIPGNAPPGPCQRVLPVMGTCGCQGVLYTMDENTCLVILLAAWCLQGLVFARVGLVCSVGKAHRIG